MNITLPTRRAPTIPIFFCVGICGSAGLSFGKNSVAMAESEVTKRMKQLEVDEADLEESFTRSSGPGGQNVNKVSTAVTLRHLPSGISVTVQDSRSQAVNRKLARHRLLDAIEDRQRSTRRAQIAAREKERRCKSPRPAALKKKILESKRKRGVLKKLRGKPGPGE